MLVLPVLDLKGGLVVRGVAGERASYLPIQSRIAASPEPLAVARAFRDHLGLDRLYVADLDALGGAPPALETFRALERDGFHLLVDAGLRSAPEARAILEAGAGEVIAALETLPGPGTLAEILEEVGVERTVFSLDMKGGRLLGDLGGWSRSEAMGVAREARRRGVRRILLLDLAAVGSRGGPAHLDLLRGLAGEGGGLEIITGGGVRSAADVLALADAGVSGVLVASALHDGAITRIDLSRIIAGSHRPAPARDSPFRGRAADIGPRISE